MHGVEILLAHGRLVRVADAVPCHRILWEARCVGEWSGTPRRGGRTRINTNGHADLIHKRPTAAELVGLIDTVSVSLNAQDRETFERHCPSAFSPDGFTPMLDYIRSARDAGRCVP